MNTPAPRTPWYRVDVFRGCKTGEVIEAEPRKLAQKLRWIALCIVLGALAFGALRWFSRVWIPRHIVELEALAKVNPVAGARKYAEFISLVQFPLVALAIVLCIVVTIRAIRLARAGRRPLPGDRVRVRTEVVAGWWCVRLPAILWGASALIGLFVLWWSYVRVVAMFWGVLSRKARNGFLSRARDERF